MPVETIIAAEFVKKVCPLLDAAKNSIEIVVFDWRWYMDDPGAAAQIFNQAVVRAAARGVKVRAVVNSDQIAGRLRPVGVSVKKILSKRLLHCKLIIIDQQIVVTGSHNYTQSAFNSNHELSVLIEDADLAQKCLAYFNNLFIL